MNPPLLFTVSPGDFYPLPVFFNRINPCPASQSIADFTSLFKITITGFIESDDFLHKSINGFGFAISKTFLPDRRHPGSI
jgi:hypothetical protein